MDGALIPYLGVASDTALEQVITVAETLSSLPRCLLAPVAQHFACHTCRAQTIRGPYRDAGIWLIDAGDGRSR